jgi:hypothetical protein
VALARDGRQRVMKLIDSFPFLFCLDIWTFGPRWMGEAAASGPLSIIQHVTK